MAPIKKELISFLGTFTQLWKAPNPPPPTFFYFLSLCIMITFVAWLHGWASPWYPPQWWLVTETCSKLYIIEYIVVFWLNDILVSTTTRRHGSYQKRTYKLSRHIYMVVKNPKPTNQPTPPPFFYFLSLCITMTFVALTFFASHPATCNWGSPTVIDNITLISLRIMCLV